MRRSRDEILGTQLLIRRPGHRDLGIRRNWWDLVRIRRRKTVPFGTITIKNPENGVGGAGFRVFKKRKKPALGMPASKIIY